MRQIAIEVYKANRNLSPTYIQELFSQKESSYDARSVRMELPKFNTKTFGKNSISYKGAYIWNDLPSDVRNAISLSDFKNIIKNWNGPFCQCKMCDRLLTQ